MNLYSMLQSRVKTSVHCYYLHDSVPDHCRPAWSCSVAGFYPGQARNLAQHEHGSRIQVGIVDSGLNK